MSEHWQDHPESNSTTKNYQIMRTPPDRTVYGVSISSNLVGAKLHYWKGRSTPCTGAECDACQNGQRPRWKGYLAIMDPKQKLVKILEFTERCYADLNSFFQQRGTLRGAQVQFSRLNRRPNGPMQVEIAEMLFDQGLLPEEPNLREILDNIWEVRQTKLWHDQAGSPDAALVEPGRF